MTIIGKTQRLDVQFGPNYRAAQVWSPKPQNFICFEPMAAIANGLNLRQERVLQGAATRRARRHLARELLDFAEGVLTGSDLDSCVLCT